MDLLHNRKIQLVLLVAAFSIFMIFLQDFNPQTLDLNFGIEFIGGVRIPISLEHAVEPEQMSLMVDTLKTRINAFGLSQAIVRPLGNKEIIVEIPRADTSAIQHVESILKKQGKFEAVIDGKQALNGNDVLSNSVGGPSGEEVTRVSEERVDWRLTFAVSATGQEKFSTVAQGKKGYPVFMFLDRPENALILMDKALLGGELNAVNSQSLIDDVLEKEGDNILLYYVGDFEAKQQEILNSSRTVVILSDSLKETHPEIISGLQTAGFDFLRPGEEAPGKKIIEKTDAELSPQFNQLGTPNAVLFSWGAIGLRSAPVLSFQPMVSKSITQYSITGSASGNENEDAHAAAVAEIRELKSVLTGGKLPVSTIVGSYYNVEPALGQNFLYYSFVGIIVALVCVAIVIIIRYRNLGLIWPVLITNVVEILLLLALIGGFGTLDLSAMAGVIALIGTGVDNQIVITDELLRKKRGEEEQERSAKEKLARAFFIVFTIAGVAIASMLPLLLSGIVEVTGFAMATVLGVLIGVGITRPAYGALVEELFVH
ncbi:MAG: hypothetical protein V1834_01535 [Candidatus Micrarchaeota archaeon]